MHSVTPSCPTPYGPMDCSQQVSSVHGIFQERILEWVAISSYRVSSWPRNRTYISCVSWIAGRFFTCWAIREPLLTWYINVNTYLNTMQKYQSKCLRYFKGIFVVIFFLTQLSYFGSSATTSQNIDYRKIVYFLILIFLIPNLKWDPLDLRYI